MAQDTSCSSNAVAEMSSSGPRWNPFLLDLGEVEVNDWVRLHIYDLHMDEAGNPENLPKLRLRPPRQADPARLIPHVRIGCPRK